MFKKLQRRLFFDLRYLKNPRWDTGISPPELMNLIQSIPAGRALDLGCGTGTNLLTLAQNGWEVVGVDLACIPVIKARIKLKKAGYPVRVINRDVTSNLRLKGSFDLILDMGCYHSLSSQGRESYRSNLKEWIRPGGVYLLYAHRCTSPDNPHGITDEDLTRFSSFMVLEWLENSGEQFPDGKGGRPATWVQYKNSQTD